jgi:two-component system sensor histidine kinase KdpD
MAYRWRTLVLALARYLLAVAATLLITLLLYPLRPGLSTSTVALIYLLPVLISTTLWGLGPGITSSFIAFLAYNYFFLKPYYTLRVHTSQDLFALLIFLVVAVLISQLVGRAKAGQEAANQRQRETTRLYDLNISLAGLNDLSEISHTLAAQTREAFQATYVELYLEEKEGLKPLKVHIPPDGIRPAQLPKAVAPLQTARGLLGEMRLWRSQPLESSDERLLQTFAAQGTLALERCALAQAETRAQALEESDRMKSALLSSVSHDLRTPLATIKASITSLLSGEVDWDTHARLDLMAVVNEETDHLNYLVGNLLAMSRIEAGALQPNRQWNVLSEIVHGVAGRLHRSLENHQLQIKVPDELPLLPVDYVLMEQVFTNLITNSIKYAPQGTTIYIFAQELKDRPFIQVQVANEGPPVAPEHLERIFDKFHRVTQSESITGTGLGLSICKGIVQAHGGRIWAENLPGRLAFNFTLPLTLEGVSSPVIKSEEEVVPEEVIPQEPVPEEPDSAEYRST